MAASDARPIPRKGVALRVTFPIYDADGDLVTGATGLDSEVSKDAGTFADATNEATEIATSSGVYYLDLTASEMDADTVAIIVKTSSSGAKTTAITLYPEEVGDVRIDNATLITAIWAAVADSAGVTTLLSRVTALLQTKAEADTAHGLLATSAALGTPAGASIAADLAAILTSVGLRLLTSGYTTPPTVGAIADAVWDELLAGHATSGSAGHYLTDAGGAADPMMASPSDYDAGTLGYLIGRLAGGRITVRGMVTPTGDMDEIVGGADYSASDGYSFDWTDADSEVAWPDLTGATVTWHGRSPDGQETTLSMTVVTPTGDKVVRLALTASQAAALVTTQTGLWTFTVWATLSPSGRVRPLVRGTVPVIELVGP